MERDVRHRAAPRAPAASAAPDEELMARYQGGEAAAFDELLDRHKRPLFGYLCRSTGDPAEAEDLFQEVFVRVLRAAPRWEAQARFTTWLYTIARNVLIDGGRRREARGGRPLSLDEAAPDGRPGPGERLADVRARPDEALLGAEHAAAVERLVAALPAEQREAFLLKREGLTFEQIGEVTGVSRNTVKSRLRYALEKLRAGLAACGLGAGDGGRPGGDRPEGGPPAGGPAGGGKEARR